MEPEAILSASASRSIDLVGTPQFAKLIKSSLGVMSPHLLFRLVPSDGPGLLIPVGVDVEGRDRDGCVLALDDRVLIGWWRGLVRVDGTLEVVQYASIDSVDIDTRPSTWHSRSTPVILLETNSAPFTLYLPPELVDPRLVLPEALTGVLTRRLTPRDALNSGERAEAADRSEIGGGDRQDSALDALVVYPDLLDEVLSATGKSLTDENRSALSERVAFVLIGNAHHFFDQSDDRRAEQHFERQFEHRLDPRTACDDIIKWLWAWNDQTHEPLVEILQDLKTDLIGPESFLQTLGADLPSFADESAPTGAGGSRVVMADQEPAQFPGPSPWIEPPAPDETAEECGRWFVDRLELALITAHLHGGMRDPKQVLTLLASDCDEIPALERATARALRRHGLAIREALDADREQALEEGFVNSDGQPRSWRERHDRASESEDWYPFAALLAATVADFD